MITTAEFKRLEKEIADRIDAAVKASPREREDIAAAFGVRAGALQKIQKGESTTQFAKLAQLAAALGKSPNELLGFDHGGEREMLRGTIEGACEGLGYPQLAAQEIAAIVLRVLDTPEVGDQSATPAERGRAIAKFLTQQSSGLRRK